MQFDDGHDPRSTQFDDGVILRQTELVNSARFGGDGESFNVLRESEEDEEEVGLARGSVEEKVLQQEHMLRGTAPSLAVALAVGCIFTVSDLVGPVGEACSAWGGGVAAAAASALLTLFGAGCFATSLVLPRLGRRAAKPALACSLLPQIMLLLGAAVSVRNCWRAGYALSLGLFGFFIGAMYFVGLGLTVSWYRDQKEVAVALYSTTIGLSTLVFQALDASLIPMWGVERTLIARAVLLLVLGGFMPRASFGPFHHDAPAKRNGRRSHDPFKALRSRRAMAYLFVMVSAWLPGWAVLSSMVPELRRAFETSERAAARLCLAPLAAMTAGRLAVGLGPRGKSLLKVRLCLAAQALAAFACASDAPPQLVVVTFVVCSFSFGAASSSYAPLAVDLFSDERDYTSVIGAAMGVYGASALAATALTASLGFAGAMRVAAAACVAGIGGTFAATHAPPPGGAAATS
mmetsp:Transcript_8293/g.29165  ORF Transcript_8293/g.29165 Transcript_8293/m.29165 type:complete len:462 (-) Transcript_8293:4-1389(-)